MSVREVDRLHQVTLDFLKSHAASRSASLYVHIERARKDPLPQGWNEISILGMPSAHLARLVDKRRIGCLGL
jgi:hypothetical protein